MRVKKKFLQLTRQTYPHGTENKLTKHLPKEYKEDGLGNFYLLIGETPSTMFTCHLDTASKTEQKIKHQFNKNFVYTNGKTILGADDKAGMVVLLSLIEKNIPGLYYFFIGEEVGCIGSGRLAYNWDKFEFSKHIKKVVSFDRRGTDSVITDQLFGTCCSDDFAIDLANKLNDTDTSFRFKPDPTGVFTDSAKFMDLVPECTNISVGYYHEHTTSERQDIVFLKKLCVAVTKIDWESLPVKRNPEEDYSYYNYNKFSKSNNENTEIEEEWSSENYSFFVINNVSKKMYISKKQIDEEIEVINNWLLSSCSYPGYNNILWNGNSLYVDMEYMEFVGNRKDLLELIPKLASVSKKYLKEKI